jgi:hypothetical protein
LGGVPPYIFTVDGAAFPFSPAAGLGMGEHTIVVIDNVGCKDSLTQDISTSSNLDGFTSAVPALCNDGISTGSVTVYATQGPGPFLFRLDMGPWLPPDALQQRTFAGLLVNSYEFWIQDGNGCEIVFPITIEELSGVEFSASIVSQPLCNGSSEGVVQLNVSEGAQDFLYSINGLGGPWIPFPINSNASAILGLPGGPLEILVEDANGCKAIENIVLTDPPQLHFYVDLISQLTCFGSNDGIIDLDGYSGTPPYNTFTINPGLISNQTGQFVGLEANVNYTIEVEDNNGCLADTIVSLSQPDELTVVFNILDHPVCATSNEGMVEFTINGGNPDYTLLIDGALEATGTSPLMATLLTPGLHTFEISDANNCGPIAGNFTLLVSDSESPIAQCQDITISLDGLGTASIVAEDLDNGSTDNCSIASYLASELNFDCTDIGVNQVELTVTDPSGNSSVCTSNVEILDTESPVLTSCSADRVVNTSPGECSAIGIALDDPVATDNCGVVLYSNDAPGLFPLGLTTVTWTIEDGNGNSTTCSSTVEVLDAEDPEITCSADQVQSTDPGVCEAAVVVVSPAFSDNCVGASISNNITGTDDASGTYPLGTTTITWTVSDAAGNTAQCTQEIGVNDDEFPQITCSADVLQTADADACEAMVGVIAPLISDNCAGSVLINDYNGTSDGTDSYPVGSTDVTWTVTDASGNSTTCVQVIEITDDQLPMAVCMDISIGLDLGGNASILASDVDGGSTDNCGITSMSVFPNSFTNADLGANNVTLTVEDAAGNSSSCVAVVTVTDDIPPTAVCQDITVVLDGLGSATITGEDIDGGSTDNGTIVSYEADPNVFTCAEVGANAVTLTVTDDGGLTGTCIATVTVLDEEDPVAQCQDITISLDGLGTASIVAEDLDNGSTDNCSIASYLASELNFDCTDIGVNQVELTVTDPSGNSSVCTSNVEILDTESPVLTSCSADRVVNTSPGECSAIGVALDDPVATDNCGVVLYSNDAPGLFPLGLTTVTWTIEDGNGNSTT